MVDTQKVSNIAEGDIDFESGGPQASKGTKITMKSPQASQVIGLKPAETELIEMNKNVRELHISPSMRNESKLLEEEKPL